LVLLLLVYMASRGEWCILWLTIAVIVVVAHIYLN
jgi:hypothetical protein